MDKNKKIRESRIGEENYNNYGTLMKIIKYYKNNDIWVEFQDEYKAKVHTNYGNFKRGEVRNPYDKTVENVGYLGEGTYSKKENEKCYNYWKHMITRCYNPYKLNKYQMYIDCFVCEEWHCFQNFAKWYERNYYEIKGERMCLDKDILIKGNKIYSPTSCCFTPQRINVLFIKADSIRGKYPIGVCYHKITNKLISQISVYEHNKTKRYHLGCFPLNKPFQAFYTYKMFKEKYIKEVAEEYKNSIPIELYNAMYKWEVEIND